MFSKLRTGKQNKTKKQRKNNAINIFLFVRLFKDFSLSIFSIIFFPFHSNLIPTSSVIQHYFCHFIPISWHHIFCRQPYFPPRTSNFWNIFWVLQKTAWNCLNMKNNYFLMQTFSGSKHVLISRNSMKYIFLEGISFSMLSTHFLKNTKALRKHYRRAILFE